MGCNYHKEPMNFFYSAEEEEVMLAKKCEPLIQGGVNHLTFNRKEASRWRMKQVTRHYLRGRHPGL